MKQLTFSLLKQLPDGSAGIETTKRFGVPDNGTFVRRAIWDEFEKFLNTLEEDGDVVVEPSKIEETKS